jgi:hypothetical protein
MTIALKMKFCICSILLPRKKVLYLFTVITNGIFQNVGVTIIAMEYYYGSFFDVSVTVILMEYFLIVICTGYNPNYFFSVICAVYYLNLFFHIGNKMEQKSDGVTELANASVVDPRDSG